MLYRSLVLALISFPIGVGIFARLKRLLIQDRKKSLYNILAWSQCDLESAVNSYFDKFVSSTIV